MPGNDLCVLPTGSGKSIVIANLVSEIGGDILVLQPSKEILEQNYSKLLLYCNPDDLALYSASVGSKKVGRITLATIQSIYKAPELFKHFKLVIIDEAHLVNPKRQGSMYKDFITAIGSPKVIGLTATPYRMDTWYKNGPYGLEQYTCTKLVNRMRPSFWDRLLFVLNNSELFSGGFLCPVKYIVPDSKIDTKNIPMNKSLSDYDVEAFEKGLVSDDDFLGVLARIRLSSKIKKCLVFVGTKETARVLCEWFNSVGAFISAFVTSDTSKKERDQIISDFKNGNVRVVFNVGVLTTGFDFPELDCILLARPTNSLALYYQMVGRGLRTAPNKEHCTVIDVTGTVQRLGRIETIEVKKDEAGKWDIFTETGRWHTKELYRRGV